MRELSLHAFLAVAVAGPASAGELAVVSVTPPRHSLTNLVTSPISVTFDQAVSPASVDTDSFWAFGRSSGTVRGAYVYSNNDRTVTLVPDRDLFFGEQVMVILSHDVEAPGGTPVRDAGYSWQFWTAAAPAPRSFATLDVVTTNAALESSRPYGGSASDYDLDGWPDMAIINEDTADVRVFLNLADGTGGIGALLVPTNPVAAQASPSEPSDFNRDGFADVCVANGVSSSVSILLGNGDGSFAPQQQIVVGSNARGIAVLDADGDGDVDVVNTNRGSSNVSILLNDGSGAFGSPSFFEGGGTGEWPLAAADMNDDGILDLVVGALDSGTVTIHTGDGDGTFTQAGTQNAGGACWMAVCGDLDGNGTEDLALANGGTNNGAVLMGDGNGNFAAPQTYAVDPGVLASDLADLDGDGDLDWVLSSFGGDWRLFTNDGGGTFSVDQEIPAPATASCALPLDLDNDGDLDLALVDEIDDTITLSINGGTRRPGDVDNDGTVDVDDFLAVLAGWGPCPGSCPPFCHGDTNFDCVVGVDDFLAVLANWG